MVFSSWQLSSIIFFGIYLIFAIKEILSGTNKLEQNFINNTFSLYPCLISEGIRNCSSLRPAQQRNRDSQETGYQIWTHACKNGWSNFTANLRVVAIKSQINQFTLISCGVGIRNDVVIFKLTTRAQSTIVEKSVLSLTFLFIIWSLIKW